MKCGKHMWKLARSRKQREDIFNKPELIYTQVFSVTILFPRHFCNCNQLGFGYKIMKDPVAKEPVY